MMVVVRLLWSVVAATCVGCASHSTNEQHDAGAGPPDVVLAAAGSSGASSATVGMMAQAPTQPMAASVPAAPAASAGGGAAPLSNAGTAGAMLAADGGQSDQADPDASDAGASGAAPGNRYACESDTTCQTHPNGDTLFTPVCDPRAKVCVECADPVQQQAMGARVITCLTLNPLRGLRDAALVVSCHRPCEE